MKKIRIRRECEEHLVQCVECGCWFDDREEGCGSYCDHCTGVYITGDC